MQNHIIYIFGKPGTGKTFLSDEIEKDFLKNEGYDSIAVNDSNLKEIISNLNQFRNTLLVIQSKNLNKHQMQALKRFVQDEEFQRAVVIQSEFDPDSEIRNYCKVYETGYPYYLWVTQIEDNLWEAKGVKSEKVARAHEKNQACELVRGYKSGGSNRINREGF
ncbi:MAG: hypothetical protein HWE07_05035 [Cytophagia bacterium]|nr:hypothetical protein [Cytophagia bacterium]